jgi:phage regulator Rha-like protein
MNALTTVNTANNTLTMSSREIAELLGCRHDSVKRTIERLVDRGVITQPPMVDESYKDGSGRTVVMGVYLIGKRDSYVIVAQLSPEFTARLVDRWQELEEQVAQKPALPQTFAEALRLAAELEEQKEALRLQNEAMKPDAQVGAIVGTRNNISVVDFAGRFPGVNKSEIRNTLGALGYLHRRTGVWTVRSQYRDKLFANRYDSAGRSVVVALEKGQKKLVELYLAGKLKMKVGHTPDQSVTYETACQAGF